MRAVGLLSLHQEVVQLSKGACVADEFDHACNCLRVSVEVRALVGASEEHVGKVRGWVQNRVPALSERGADDKGACFPLALPLEAEVILATWAEPDEEARSKPFGVGSELLPRGDMVTLKCSGAGGLFGVEMSSPELDNDDVGALLRSDAEGLHGGFQLIEKGIRACVKAEPEGYGVEVSQPGDGRTLFDLSWSCSR